MSLLRRVAIGLGVALALGAAALGIFIATLPDLLCADTVLGEIPSPSGALKAVVFTRDCGATTDYSTQVSIIDVDEPAPEDGGDTFIADTDHGRAPAWRGRGPEVRVHWTSETAIEIQYPVQARVFLAASTTRGVQVSYGTF